MAETDSSTADGSQHFRPKTLEIGCVELLERRRDDVHEIVLPEGRANVPHGHIDSGELPGAVISSDHNAPGGSLVNARRQQIVDDHHISRNAGKLAVLENKGADL
jgi:hypothetical protein